jgi:hypothetical protein
VPIKTDHVDDAIVNSVFQAFLLGIPDYYPTNAQAPFLRLQDVLTYFGLLRQIPLALFSSYFSASFLQQLRQSICEEAKMTLEKIHAPLYGLSATLADYLRQYEPSALYTPTQTILTKLWSTEEHLVERMVVARDLTSRQDLAAYYDCPTYVLLFTAECAQSLDLSIVDFVQRFLLGRMLPLIDHLRYYNAAQDADRVFWLTLSLFRHVWFVYSYTSTWLQPVATQPTLECLMHGLIRFCYPPHSPSPSESTVECLHYAVGNYKYTTTCMDKQRGVFLFGQELCGRLFQARRYPHDETMWPLIQSTFYGVETNNVGRLLLEPSMVVSVLRRPENQFYSSLLWYSTSMALRTAFFDRQMVPSAARHILLAFLQFWNEQRSTIEIFVEVAFVVEGKYHILRMHNTSGRWSMDGIPIASDTTSLDQLLLCFPWLESVERILVGRLIVRQPRQVDSTLLASFFPYFAFWISVERPTYLLSDHLLHHAPMNVAHHADFEPKMMLTSATLWAWRCADEAFDAYNDAVVAAMADRPFYRYYLQQPQLYLDRNDFVQCLADCFGLSMKDKDIYCS